MPREEARCPTADAHSVKLRTPSVPFDALAKQESISSSVVRLRSPRSSTNFRKSSSRDNSPLLFPLQATSPPSCKGFLTRALLTLLGKAPFSATCGCFSFSELPNLLVLSLTFNEIALELAAAVVVSVVAPEPKPSPTLAPEAANFCPESRHPITFFRPCDGEARIPSSCPTMHAARHKIMARRQPRRMFAALPRG